MEDHFDRSPELEQRLLASGKQDVYEEMVAISKLANIHYMRQKETKGTGHAVLGARTFVGDEPFVVLYGDDVILGDNPVCRQVCDLYDQYDLGVVGMKEVPTELVMKYCTLDVTTIQDKIFKVTDMIEKPSREQIISHYSILGRCVLPPKIFPILENTQPGAGGEIQLTDAMCELAHQEGMIGLDFDGTRYDMGNKLGILEAIVQVGLSHKDIGQQFREYLKQVAKEL